MSEVNEKLSESLGIEYVPEEKAGELVPVEEHLPVIAASPERDVEYDYEYSRETHRELIDQGQEALHDLLKVAKESQHPRAYEVAATMLKNLSDMTDKLMVLHEKKKSIESKKDGPTHATQVNADTVVFAGSTADLLKKIRKE